MGADVSRIRANPLLDYSGVEIQQGRVALDGDFNELVAVLDRRARAAASDILGRSTVSSTTPDAFRITPAAGGFEIGVGRMYVDGLLAENHGAPSADPAKRLFDPLLSEARFADRIAYDGQPYLPNGPALPTSGRYLVYLDVWDRELTHLERPDLVEIALGVDTSSRRQTVWQVRVLAEDAGTASCDSPDSDISGWLTQIAPSDGRLTTGTFDAPPEEDPCELPPSGGYRGLENQTYRVEIHDGGTTGTATFKWSRENASVGSRVATLVSATELELQTLGRDEVLRFNAGDWVEITDDARELSQRCGEMRQITVNETARRISFTPGLPAEMLPAAFPDSTLPQQHNLRVRRWDQGHKVLRIDANATTSIFQDLDGGSSGVIAVPPAGTTLLLEHGITVSFSSGSTGFRAGDYWVFAARTADASVEVVDDMPPRGIFHHYARLGIWDVDAGTVTDCRHAWPPAGGEGHDCSCEACVTPRSHASGTFTIQDAVNRLRGSGGTVCLGPGEYVVTDPVRIVEANSVRIRGQGTRTLVAGPAGVFAVQGSASITIENLSVLSLGRHSAISATTVLDLVLQQLTIAVTDPTGDMQGAAISLQGTVAGVTIRENVINGRTGIVTNEATPLPAGDDVPASNFLVASGVAIDDNRFSCERQGIAFDATARFIAGNRITGNHVLGCRDVGIATLGVGAPGASLSISRNRLFVSGDGIRSSAGDLWIDGNTIAPFTRAPDATALTHGILVLTGSDKNGIERCEVLANQVTGFSNVGIGITTPARALLVKQNIVTDCGTGIVVAGGDRANDIVAIENNQVRDIGVRAVTVGISVTRASSVTVAGNAIRSVGVKAVQGPVSAGVMILAVPHVRVLGNDISEIAPPGDFLGYGAGVLLQGPYTDFEIAQNQIRRDAVGSSQSSGVSWFAVSASEVDATTPVRRIGDYLGVRVDAARVLLLGPEGPLVATVGDAATSGAAQVARPARGSVIGNTFQARGVAPAADVGASGECVFSSNRVDSVSGRQAVLLRTTTAIVNGNRVRSGDVSIEIDGSTSAAVMGNITTGVIVVPGGLPPPWDALNLRG